MEKTVIKSFNDDDIYVFNSDTFELIDQVGSSCPRRINIKYGFEKFAPGVEWKTGMSAKRLPIWFLGKVKAPAAPSVLHPSITANAHLLLESVIELSGVLRAVSVGGPAYDRAQMLITKALQEVEVAA